MAERDEIGSSLGGHDASNAGDAEYITFVGALAFAEKFPGARVGEGDVAGCGGESFGFGFGGYLGHVDGLRCGEVWEVGVGCCWEGVRW